LGEYPWVQEESDLQKGSIMGHRISHRYQTAMKLLSRVRLKIFHQTLMDPDQVFNRDRDRDEEIKIKVRLHFFRQGLLIVF
jgi:hypothetical protein